MVTKRRVGGRSRLYCHLCCTIVYIAHSTLKWGSEFSTKNLSEEQNVNENAIYSMYNELYAYSSRKQIYEAETAVSTYTTTAYKA